MCVCVFYRDNFLVDYIPTLHQVLTVIHPPPNGSVCYLQPLLAPHNLSYCEIDDPYWQCLTLIHTYPHTRVYSRYKQINKQDLRISTFLLDIKSKICVSYSVYLYPAIVTRLPRKLCLLRENCTYSICDVYKYKIYVSLIQILWLQLFYFYYYCTYVCKGGQEIQCSRKPPNLNLIMLQYNSEPSNNIYGF